ncbi:MAG: hypothetical protein LAO30_24495 [Acidobacteriia bacterium]|nr:hypothetical protein [Terriglobia bacterium]
MFVPLQVPEQPSSLATVLDVVDKITKILAVVIGGAWAYVNYVRGRTYKKKLEVDISGEWFESAGASFLSGSARLKNVGLSKFSIQQKGTAVLVYGLRPSTSAEPITDVIANLISVRSVFEDHGWIEPGETIVESFLVQVSERTGQVAIKLSLRVVAAHIEWNANTIVKPLTPQPSEPRRIDKPNRSAVEKGEAVSEQGRDAKFPGTPESSVPVTTQIKERLDITDEIERQKAPVLTDPEKPPERV